MHWKRFCLVSLSLAWMAFPARVRAQETSPAPGSSGPGYSSVDNLSGAMTLTSGGGTYLLFNKQTGQAVGIPNGYSRIGIRHTIFEDGPQQVFGEAHALITDSNRYGFNAGLGYRVMVDDAMWGVNGWYDTLQSDQAFNYRQAGVGVEYQSGPLDVRANGYIPFGKQSNFLSVVDPGTTPVFVGHDFSTLGSALFQQSLTGFDAEAGIPVPVINWLRMYAGFYHLAFEQDDTWGVRSRVEGRLTQGVNLSFQVTNDEKFGTNLNVGVDVRFDGRLPTRFGGSNDAYSRRYDQVRRQWQVQLAQNTGAYAVPLNDPTTGDKLEVTWVNNTFGAGGDGTVERPYNVLPSSVNSDYVIVKRGVGDTVGNIALQNGQDLFGEGKAHQIDTDRLGLVTIPTSFLSNTGAFPTLRANNLAAPVVTLADNNIVSGFNMIGGSAAAIAGTGTDNFLIECVNATSASGVSIVDGGGIGTIRESNFINTSLTGVGVSVSNTAGPALNLVVDDVTTQGGAVGTAVRSTGGAVVLNMRDYQGADHTNAGVILQATGSTLTANVTNAALTNVGDGFRFDVAGGGTLSGTMSTVSATGSGNLLEGNVNGGALNLSATNATLSGSTGGSGVALNLIDATGGALFTNLAANGNAVDGASSVATGAATNYQLEIHDSSLVGNTNDAVHSTVLGGANMVVIVDPTAATNSGNSGFEFDVSGASSHLTAIFSDTNLSNSGNDGVNGSVINGGRADVVFDRNPNTGSGRHGLNVVVDNGSTLAGVFRDGSLSQSGVGNNGVGINVEVTNNSNVGLTFGNTTATNNGVAGLAYQVDGGSLLSTTFTNSNLSSNPINNVVGTVDGDGSRAILSFTNTNANSLASNGGFAANVTNGADLFSTWNNSNVSGTQGDGVRVVGSGNDTQIGLTFNNSLIENNLGNGLVASLTGGNSASSLGIQLNDSTLVNNGIDGLNVSVDGLGVIGAVDINSTPITDNNRDGFEYDVTGGAQFSASVTGTGNDFSRNGDNGIDGFVSGAASTAVVTVDGADINDSGQSGVLLIAQQQGQNQFALSNSSITRSGAHGVEAVASTTGQLAFTLNNVDITQSQRNGITFDAVTGGDVTGSVTGSTTTPPFGPAVIRGLMSNNGVGVPSSGVRGNVNGVGSTANVLFNAVQVNSNTLHGFQLNSGAGGALTATMNSGALGTLSANTNAGDGIRLAADGAGSSANLLMFGSSVVNNNGGNGLRVSGSDAEQVAVQFAGSANGNGADGINVSLSNVNNAAIELAPTAGTIQNNVGDGIQIDLVDTDLTNLTVNGTLVESLKIQGLSILNNGGDGLRISADNSDLASGVISGNTITGNAGSGLLVDLVNGSDWNLNVLNNSLNSNGGFGFHITQGDGTSKIVVDGNQVVGNTLGNIIVDLNGTAVSELHIDNNVVDGDGVVASDTFTPGLNFLGTTLDDTTGVIPPDTMGAVGLNEVVEMINGAFAVYDKTTGALISRVDLDTFWLSAGLPSVQTGSFDPRIVFDPTVNRWFAASLDAPATASGAGNNILVAVSDTSDPSGTWSAFRFRGDTEFQSFNDYVTLGVDNAGVHLATINFPTAGPVDLSAYTIPKADLLSATPTIANLTRMEDQPLNLFGGGPLQPAIDFSSPDNRVAVLSANDNGGNTLTRTNIFTFGNFAGLGGTTDIAVPVYAAPQNARQPGAPAVENDAARFGSNVVEVNGSLWAAHAVDGTGTSNSAIRWYQIDVNTNAVLQTGVIENPNVDYFYPSIAVNDTGAVVIGFSGSGPTQFISSMAAFGSTTGGVTSFQSPVILAAGAADYNLTFGGGRNRWGDYSSTVVDPTDPNKFWTFQERVSSLNTWGVQITEIDHVQIDAIAGTTVGDAIAVSVSDSARLLAPSSINNNTVTGHGGDGIRVNLNDTGSIDNLTIDGNTVTGNTGNGIGFLTTGTPTLGQLSISNSANVSNNGGNGINVQLFNVTGAPDITIDGNNVHDNAGLGIAVDGVDSSVGIVSVQSNTIANNVGGDGLRVNLSSTTGAHVVDRVLANNNIITGNAGDGIEIDLLDLSVTTDVLANNNQVSGNTGRGIVIDVLNTDLNDVVVSSNSVDGNTGGDGISVLLNNTTGGSIVADQIVMIGNSVTSNAGDGVNVLLNQISNVTEVLIDQSNVLNNTGGGVSVVANGTAISNISLQGNTILANTGGDGAHLELIDSSSNSLVVEGNEIEVNNGEGLQILLDNSSLGELRIDDNNAGTAAPAGTYAFTGNTNNLGWFLQNTSNNLAIEIENIEYDITGNRSGLTFATERGFFARPFGHFAPFSTAVGFESVNGLMIDPTLTPTTDLLGNVPVDGGVADGSTVVNWGFNDFQSNAVLGGDFGFSATLVAGDAANNSIFFGGDLSGSPVRVTFTGGRQLIGRLSNASIATFGASQIFPASSGGISNNTSDGIQIQALNGSNVGSMSINNNVVDSNAGDGVVLDIQDSVISPAQTILVNQNRITNNTGSGFSLVNPDTNGTPIEIEFDSNTITGNTGGPGIDLQIDDDLGALTTRIVNSTISNNAGGGVNLLLSQSVVADVTDFSGNTVSNNGSVGLRIDATDNAQFALAMGATGHNTFNANVDAGLGVTMNSNSQGQLSILDSQFDNTTNGANTTFNGEGIHIQMQDNAVLPNLVIGDPVAGTSTATGNASHGVQVFVDGFSQLVNPTIQNMTINSNGGDGINVERRGIGVIDNFVISSNNLNANRGDGFDIRARAANLTDEYTITNNTINGSTGRGIAFGVDGDADITTNLDGNTITNNGGTGITVNSTLNAVTDTPTFTGTWLASTITGNGGRGVDIQSPGHIIQIGDATAAFPDTIISNNAQAGVFVGSLGTLDLDNVEINGNGAGGVVFQGGTGGLMTIDRAEISGNTGHGVDLLMNGNTLSVTNSRIASNTLDGVRVNSVAGVNDVTLTNNIMTLNTQDGLEVINNSAAGFTATITNSQFTSNTERGVAIINRGSGQANVTLDDNQIVSNGEEGVYVVNTASADQSTRANATVALSSNGLVNATPDLVFAMNRNTVSANGLNSGFTATGLVVRVGTADGGSADFTDDGGFAATRAGVTATVQDNILQGNAGSDVFFQSFVSTVDPLASVGTWDAATFALATYQTDPLARLDLVYGNNVADSTDATTIGASYNNAEGLFKSRLTSQTPAGPFATATRDRNAQRLADRDVAAGGTLLDPNAPTVQASYLYSGVGASTFRVMLNPGNVFGTGAGFILDNAPYVDLNDAQGVGGPAFPFGWGTLP